MASYDVSMTPATPALSIRRKKIAPLPMQLRKNVSPDKAVFLLGPLTSDPYEIATTWNECRASMGHTLIGHPSSKWDEVFISQMLQRYQVISDTIRGQAPHGQPPCPYNHHESPFLEANLLGHHLRHHQEGWPRTLYGAPSPFHENLEFSCAQHARWGSCSLAYPMVSQPSQTDTQTWTGCQQPVHRNQKGTY